MKKVLLVIALFIVPALAFSQNAELVINGTTEVTIVEHGGTKATPVYIEVNNPNATNVANPGIPTPLGGVGTKGFIISENEFDMVKWDIGTGVALSTYTVPFGYNGGANLFYLPLSLTVKVPGILTATGTGLKFSTWHTQADDWTGTTSLTGAPSDVTNMAVATPPGSPSNNDDSYNVVSRFWVMDTASYTDPPRLSNITFTYIDNAADSSEVLPTPAGHKVPGLEANLAAQRFNPTPKDGWGGFLAGGDAANTPVAGTGQVSTGLVTDTNFMRSWTLSSVLHPLPIVLGAFSTQCDNGAALVQWTAESEVNNAYYTIKKSADDTHFEIVGTVKGSGNSSLPISYSLVDNSPYSGISYYYISQTDFDENTTDLSVTQFNGCGGGLPVTTVNAFNTNNGIEVQINSASADNFTITLTNMLGQAIINESHAAALGENEILLSNTLSTGIYILNIRNDKLNYTKKLALGVR